MSLDSEGLGVRSNLTQPSGISHFHYTLFSEVLASVMILDRNSLLDFVKIFNYVYTLNIHLIDFLPYFTRETTLVTF